MTTLFVTASGTGVGKTFVTTRLIAELRAARRTVRALKPVASGFDAARPDDSDSGELLRALGLAAQRRESRRRVALALRGAALARHGRGARTAAPSRSPR